MNLLQFTPFPQLNTDRLVLRQLAVADDNDIFFIRSNEDVNRYLDRTPAASITDARFFIKKINESVNKNEGIYWGIQLKESPTLIGTICFWNIEIENSTAEIGYELKPMFQHRGIMQEAVLQVINYGFNLLQLDSITASPRRDNHKSIVLLEKLNFAAVENLKAKTDIGEANYLLYKLTAPGKR